MTKKPIKKTQSITINDVPTEYVELFNTLVEWFPRTGKQVHTVPKVLEELPKGELRTLFFCEMVHQAFDKKYSSGTADDYIDKHRHNRNLLDNSPATE